MARLQHLLQDEPQAPVYQLDFGDRVTQTVAEVVAQEAVNRLTPAIAAMVEQAKEIGLKTDSAAQTFTDSSKALEGAVASEVSNLKKDLNSVVKDAVRSLAKANTQEAASLRDSLITALSKVRIPDYTDKIEQVKAVQTTILAALKDIEPDKRPAEWEFTVNRNSRGFIQTVTAKAK